MFNVLVFMVEKMQAAALQVFCNRRGICYFRLKLTSQIGEEFSTELSSASSSLRPLRPTKTRLMQSSGSKKRHDGYDWRPQDMTNIYYRAVVHFGLGGHECFFRLTEQRQCLQPKKDGILQNNMTFKI